MAGVKFPHRYYLLKAVEAERVGDRELAATWRAKHRALPGRPLPYLYPLIPTLAAAEYFKFEDLLGATAQEMVGAGMSRVDAEAALYALTGGNEDMGYTMKNGRFANVEPVTLAASAARTADGEGAALELGDRQTLRLALDVTAIAGDVKTLDVTVETRRDENDDWRTVGTFTQKAAVGAERKCFTGLDREVRVKWDLGAQTTSATFSVEGEAA